MSRLMRMAYGHGGTRLERTFVSRHHQGPTPSPLRLKLLLLAIWITVPALVSLYAIPKTSLPMKTMIDISRLAVKQPPEPEKLIIAEPKPVPPVEQNTEPPPKPLAAPEQAVEPPRVRQALSPQVEEAKRPSIARTAPADLPDLAEQKLLAARERRRVEAEAETNPAPRIRRGVLPGETAAERTPLSRARSTAAQDEPVGRERAAVVRRQTTSDAAATASGTPPQRVARSERPYSPPDEGAPRGGRRQGEVQRRRRRERPDGDSGRGDPRCVADEPGDMLQLPATGGGHQVNSGDCRDTPELQEGERGISVQGNEADFLFQPDDFSLQGQKTI